LVFRYTQCHAHSLDEKRLARAEWSTQQQDLATFQSRSELMTVIEGFFRRGTDELAFLNA
jgi:hypothetical protein